MFFKNVNILIKWKICNRKINHLVYQSLLKHSALSKAMVFY